MDDNNYFESLFDMEKDRAVFEDSIYHLKKINHPDEIRSVVAGLFVIDKIHRDTIVTEKFIVSMMEYAPQVKGKRGFGVDNLRVFINKLVSWEDDKDEYVRRKALKLSDQGGATASFRIPDASMMNHIEFLLRQCGIELSYHGARGFDGITHCDDMSFQFTAPVEYMADALQRIFNEMGADALSGITYCSDYIERENLTLSQTINIAEYEKQI